MTLQKAQPVLPVEHAQADKTWSLRRVVRGGDRVVVAGGELDLAAAADLRAVLAAAVERRRSRLVLDLADVTFMDCAVLRVLITTQEQVRPLGGKVSLVGCPPVVQRLLALTRTEHLFDELDR